MLTNIHCGQPNSRPNNSGPTNSVRPANRTSALTRSSCARCFPCEGISHIAASTSATPIGPLTTNIVRQPRPYRLRVTSQRSKGDEAHRKAAQPERDAKNRERPAARRIGEQIVDRGKDLRHHQCGCAALGETREDQRTPRGRRTACERGCGKSDEANEERTPGPIHVAKTPAGDDHRCIGDLIDRDHALDLRRAGIEIGAYGWDCDVHYENVDHIHELRGNNHRQNKPASRVDGVSERYIFHDTAPLLDENISDVRFRRAQTLVREGSPLVKLRNSA